MKNRRTSAAVAKKAAKVLKSHTATKAEKAVAASALSQRAPKRRK